MKIYCMDCGTSIEFAHKRPNFCFSCGCKLSLAKIEKPKVEEIEEDNYDDNSDDYSNYKEFKPVKLDLRDLGIKPYQPLDFKSLAGTQSAGAGRTDNGNGVQELKRMQAYVSQKHK